MGRLGNVAKEHMSCNVFPGVESEGLRDSPGGIGQ
jgi:hypothetical protein